MQRPRSGQDRGRDGDLVDRQTKRVRLCRTGGLGPVSYTHLDVYKRQPTFSRNQLQLQETHENLDDNSYRLKPFITTTVRAN